MPSFNCFQTKEGILQSRGGNLPAQSYGSLFLVQEIDRGGDTTTKERRKKRHEAFLFQGLPALLSSFNCLRLHVQLTSSLTQPQPAVPSAEGVGLRAKGLLHTPIPLLGLATRGTTVVLEHRTPPEENTGVHTGTSEQLPSGFTTPIPLSKTGKGSQWPVVLTQKIPQGCGVLFGL